MTVLFDANEPTFAMLEEGAQVGAKMNMGCVSCMTLPMLIISPVAAFAGVLIEGGDAGSALLALALCLAVYFACYQKQQLLLDTLGAMIMRGAKETYDIKPTVVNGMA